MTTEALIKPFREKDARGNTVAYNFSAPQAWVYESDYPVTVMQAGTGSGKTSIGSVWSKKQCDSRGPGDGLVVAPTYPLMQSRVIPELKEEFLFSGWGEYHPGLHPPQFHSHEKDANGEPLYRIFLASAANPESLESATAKWCWIDELAQKQFNRASWEAIQRRVAFHEGPILGTTTLYDPGNWYKFEIYDQHKAGNRRIDIIEASSLSNPAYSRERFYEAQRRLPYWKFSMFYLGRYEKPTGLIYDCFDDENNIIDGFNLNLDEYLHWPRLIGHDFGPNNTAAVAIAQDPGTGWLYVYDEYLKGGLSVAKHAENFKLRWGKQPVRVRAGGAAGKHEQEIRDAYTLAGWPIRAPNIEGVESGITHAYGLVADGHLFVFRHCEMFINELMSYSREIDESYEATEKIEDKNRFHLMDSWRYIASMIDPKRVKGDAIKVQRFRGRARKRARGTPISQRLRPEPAEGAV